MTQVDTFGAYTRTRLDAWGREFALCRDCEYLGHQSKNMLQILIEHRGEMPGRVVGFKPLQVNLEALQVEQIITGLAKEQMTTACAMRGYYCGSGRRKVERWETANLLIATAGHRVVSQRHYLTLIDIGEAYVRGVLQGIAIAA